MKSSTKVSNVIITALPKSGCFRQRSASIPAIKTWGRKPIWKLRIDSRFFERE